MLCHDFRLFSGFTLLFPGKTLFIEGIFPFGYFCEAGNCRKAGRARVFQEPAAPTAKATSLSGGLLSHDETDSDFNVFAGCLFQSVVSYLGNIRRNFVPVLIPHEQTHSYRVI